jgi:hypothetical protein
MAHSFFKQYSKRYRKVIVRYVDFNECFHVKIFKDCSLIEASDVFKAYARAYGWIFLSYDVFDY